MQSVEDAIIEMFLKGDTIGTIMFKLSARGIVRTALSIQDTLREALKSQYLYGGGHP